jgi:hypothetical protein
MANYYGPNSFVTEREANQDRNRTTRYHPRPVPTALDSRAKKLLQAMWYGVDEDFTTPTGKVIPRGTPMGDAHAAMAIGMRQKHLRWWRVQRVFINAVQEQSVARRQSEEPENLAVAMNIRDNDPDNKTKLAAIATIRVKEPVHAVNVDLSRHDSRQQTVVAPAGYVINLSGKPYAELTDDERSAGSKNEDE